MHINEEKEKIALRSSSITKQHTITDNFPIYKELLLLLLLLKLLLTFFL